MTMPSKIQITDFKNLDDSNRTLLVWQGLMDAWNKIEETIDHQKDIEADTKVHHKLLVTGNGEPSVMERLRLQESFSKSIRYWATFVAGAIILQTIAFAWAVFIAIVRFLPVLERLAIEP